MSTVSLNATNAATFNEVSAKKDNTFELHYFKLHGLGYTSRALLAISGSKFKSVVPEDWATQKAKSPFGVLPLLKETSSDGKTIEIAESDAIERYLAAKFDLLGKDTFEQTAVLQYLASTNALLSTIFAKYYSIRDDPERKAAAKEVLISTTIPAWVQSHEKHLQASGANGHYVGNKLTLADIKTQLILLMVQSLSEQDLVSEKLTPGLWKVKVAVEAEKHFLAWKETEEYKALSAANYAMINWY